MKISEMKINSAAVEQGEWVGAAYGSPIPEMGDLCLRVRGMANADFRALQTRLFEATPRSRRPNNRLVPQEADRIFTECMIETILLDWKGMLGEDDAEVPFSKALSRKLLSDADMKPFKDAVAWAASTVGEMRAADADATAKN